MKTKTLEQMEARAAATPKGAVLLWLGRYVKDKAAPEHVLGLNPGMHGYGAREQIKEQLEAAIGAELQGEEPARIEAAVRQAQKEAYLLMLLATETERWVREESANYQLRIDLARERMRNAELRGAAKAAELIQQRGQPGGKMDARKIEAAKKKMAREAMRECTEEIRSAALSVLDDKLMCDMIRHAYFDGQAIMPEWFAGCLEDAAKRAEELIADHDGQAEQKIEGEGFRSEVRASATWYAKMFEMIARVKMLNEFGEYGEAQRVAELHTPGLLQETFLKLPMRNGTLATGSQG